MHVSRQIGTVAGILLSVLLAADAQSTERRLEILGWIEDARLAPEGLPIRAKLDTGADNSSLNAPEVEEFERDDEEWVRFTVENSDGESQTFEKPVERMVRIRSASGVDRRHVIRMTVCIGDVLREVDVNLADRSELSYQMLIGRSYMKNHVLVDSARKFTMKPVCDMDDDSASGEPAAASPSGDQDDEREEDD